MGVGSKQGTASLQSLGPIATLPLTNFATLGKPLPFLGPQFPICKMDLTLLGMIRDHGAKTSD